MHTGKNSLLTHEIRLTEAWNFAIRKRWVFFFGKQGHEIRPCWTLHYLLKGLGTFFTTEKYKCPQIDIKLKTVSRY